MVMRAKTINQIVLVSFAIAFALTVDAAAFISESPRSLARSGRSFALNNVIFDLRGGEASLELEESDNDLEIESSDVDEEYDDEEDEDVKLDPKLAKSAQASAVKMKTKATASAKAAVNAKLDTPAKKKKSGLLKIFRIPYIVKAVLNPFVLMQMTKGYFASLFNLDYLKDNKDSSQDLRSALEAKAKKGDSGGSRGKRKMKPGQAKTLSDLPQLNT